MYSYSPGSDELVFHMEGLFFANGVTLGPGDEYVLVSETGHGRIHRLWLKGPNKGRSELFASGFPGVTDNISFNGRDTVWVALPALRDVRVAQAPALRRILAGLPRRWWLPERQTAFVVGLNLQGEVIHNLQFSQQQEGVPFSDITSVKELDGRLYLGSLVEGRVGVINIQ
ncbi:MAG: strictosidine synthase family protein [Arenicella sp.]|nr:strictosidine synthase family protein [Arenicella sp.]